MKARVERKIAAVLASDVVGFSRMMEADEVGTVEAIQRLRTEVIQPLVDEHRGRVIKLMGDGTLVEFASVVDAVACAAAIQKKLKRAQRDIPKQKAILLRIGVNLGDVVVDGEDLLGDGVNVAARLEQLCEPGGVLVSGTAFDQLPGKVKLKIKDAGEKKLKNIARPIRTYRVVIPQRVGVRAAPKPLTNGSRKRLYAAVLLILLVTAVVGYHFLGGKRAEEGATETAVVLTTDHKISLGDGTGVAPIRTISDRVITVHQGDSLNSILANAGASFDQAQEFVRGFTENFSLHFSAGEKIWVEYRLLDESDEGPKVIPFRVSVYASNDRHLGTIELRNGVASAKTEPQLSRPCELDGDCGARPPEGRTWLNNTLGN